MLTVLAKIINPLKGLSREELFRDVSTFASENNLGHIEEDLKKVRKHGPGSAERAGCFDRPEPAAL